jgi:uncharacterized membrane protein
MRKFNLVIVWVLFLGIGGAVDPGSIMAQGHGPTLEWIDVPLSNQARANGISPTGDISGLYITAGINHGFVLDRDGYRTLDVPGALHTQLQKVSPTGDAVGFYQIVAGVMRGFLFSRNDGTFHFIDYPESSQTTPWGMNARGDIVGGYVDGSRNRAFLLSDGVFTNIDVPNAFASTALDINSQGDIVGRYLRAQGEPTRMFLRSRHGDYYSIDVPNALFTGNPGFPGGINDKGEIVGMYQDGDDLKVRGFLLDASGFYIIDVPNTFFTAAAGIDNHGNIVGRHRVIGSNRDTGFLLRR